MSVTSRVASLLVIVCTAAVVEAGHAFRLDEVTALPETARLHVGLFLTGSGEISGFDVEVAYTRIDLRFVEIDLTGGLLAGVSVTNAAAVGDEEHGRATVSVTLAQPLALPAGESRLLDLVFFLGGGIEAGSALDMMFAATPTVVQNGADVDGTGQDGSVRIVDDNVLLLENAWGYPGQADIPMELKVYNKDALMGLSVSCSFDSQSLRLQDVTAEGTMTEALEAEFFQPVISNDEGNFVLGILLDAAPPIDPALRYPATGYRLRLARLIFQVRSDAQEEQDVAVSFVDGFGNPPINNRVVVDHESVVPLTMDGTFRIGRVPIFRRGDSNSDGRIDIADPIKILDWLFRDRPILCEKAADADDDGSVWLNDSMYMLEYLFLFGPVIPPPFPNLGTDPTPDELSCEG